ncbi:hypothetical protein TVAG_359670 [Trichomonas vaginalis G3]|uniref:Uncharacterized protein n=1 Tax=Trichomonas vaginalis (strain ATCC PRA-98 / G3) TaxID=412133 RepID=A2DT86_TRIV3|nr:hypothetical protein TVAGG3_0968370 [Trichomonas vaginalis G3]EAY16358.1 hypothetical protein TVAG_359670 [Trichomonas vaginalis G3]KAI5488412.1 hypothetical protein TVAGG3_0968370 [Trichomonas vaginalis G3]|eukprot:XP_001328581.1 hypothetical protein [Trichomonas vaginalis G3]
MRRSDSGDSDSFGGYYYSDTSDSEINEINDIMKHNKQDNINCQNEVFEPKAGLISSYLNMPRALNINDFKSVSTFNFASFTSIPPAIPVNLTNIHMELKNIYIDPFNENPESRQIPRYPTVFDDAQGNGSGQKMFEWRTFQLPNVPEVDVSIYKKIIHEKFDITKLVSLLHKI